MALKKRICNLLLQQELIQVNFFTIVSLTSSFDPERKIKLYKKKQCDRCFFVLLRLVHFFNLIHVCREFARAVTHFCMTKLRELESPIP